MSTEFKNIFGIPAFVYVSIVSLILIFGELYAPRLTIGLKISLILNFAYFVVQYLFNIYLKLYEISVLLEILIRK